MKNVKKLLSVLLMIFVSLSPVPLGGLIGIELPNCPIFTLETKALTDGNLIYTVKNDEATVTGCEWDAIDIVIPSTIEGYPVTSISDYAFSNSDLFSITIPDSITSLGEGAFEFCNELTYVKIGKGITVINDNTFYCCFNLRSVILPDCITSIGESAFDSCESLESVTLPAELITIGKNAFLCCGALKSITFPYKVTSIGDGAFNSCDNLADVSIPKNVTSIGAQAFAASFCLSKFIVDGDNEFYCNDENGVLYNKDKTELIQYPIANKSTEYIIPDSVKSIAATAFSSCDSLTSVTIPDSVITIGRSAFYDCDGITSIKIPKNVTSIEDSTYSYCDNLNSIEIPATVTSIGSTILYGCKNFTDVYFHGTEEDWEKISFGYDNRVLLNATIHFLSKYEFKAVEDSDVVIDSETKKIYGLEEGIADLAGYVECDGCELEYNPTAFGFGTGTTVDIVKDGEVVDTYTIVIFGDINGDGYVDAFDVPDVMAFTNCNSQYESGSAQELAADINGDGFVDESDLFLIDLASTFSYTIEQAR